MSERVSPERLDAFHARLRIRYTFYVSQDLRRFRLRPWWATGTQGMMMFSELVWRARSREKLEQKCRRFARRDMLSRGVRGEPDIRFEER